MLFHINYNNVCNQRIYEGFSATEKVPNFTIKGNSCLFCRD